MKKIIVLLLICLLSFSLEISCSDGSDNLPPISEAPKSDRIAAATAILAITDITYDYEISGILTPNVTVSDDQKTFTFANAERNVTIDYVDYTVNVTGKLSAENNSKGVVDLSIVRTVTASGTYYCTLYVVVESGTTKKTTNVSLIIGIIFSIFGMGGLITFLILWSKGKLSPAMGLKAIIPILAACVVVSSVGLISLTTSAAKGGGGGGIGCTFKPGYYLQSTGQYSGSSNGIAFVQVGLSCYRFNSDGTVNYCAACETNDASDFKADSGYGTWTKSGCSLSFNYTTPMGSVSTTFTISGDKLLYNGTEAYHWVRGE